MKKIPMKTACYNILADGDWHGCGDFVHLGLSYRNRLNEIKHDGEQSGNFILESRKDGTKPTFEYRMLKVVKSIPISFKHTTAKIKFNELQPSLPF